MRTTPIFAGLLMIAAQTAAAHAAAPAAAAEPAPPVPATQAFPLSAVRLLDGPFKRNMMADQSYMLSLEPDRLLAGFRLNAGLPEKAKILGGWESRGISGEMLGHYLSACSMMYAATGDQRFLDRANYIVGELAACQAAAPDGFVGGMPRGRALFAEIERGDIRIDSGFHLNGGWVPWYNQHKLFAGLRDAYLFAGSDKAKAVLVKLGDWCGHVVANLNDQQMQTMLTVEQGGMMETLADLYAITGDDKYRALAKRFWHKRVLDPLADGRDVLSGLHANTNIPKVIGAARLYELTGDPRDATTAETFWTAVTRNRSFVTGSNSDHEHFFDLGLEAKKLGPENGETCNVYNMLKLTGHLARWTGQAGPYDYYERAMFNHILGSIDPDTGHCTYFQSLQPGRFKVYSSAADSFWCCVGTGFENHSKYAADVYTHTDDALDVNLFVASELTWKDKGLTLRQATDFPAADTTTLTLTLDRPTHLPLRVRVPGWADQGIDVTGAATAHGEPGSGYLTIDRTWQSGDAITVRLPMTLKLHHAEDDATMAAAVYGPVVLAAQLGREDMPPTDNVPSQTQFDNRPIPADAVPLIVTDAPVGDWLKPVDGQPLHFKTAGVGRPGDVEFAPLAATHHQRYAVYNRVVNDAQYQALQAQLAAEQEAARQLAARTVDEVVFGEQQPEQDHAVKSENSYTGHAGGRAWRDAASGGFFSATVTVKPDVVQVLRVTYWGGDNDRTFDVLADGKVLATQHLTAAHPDAFFDVDYPLAAGTGDAVTITFRPRANSVAGGVFGCRVLTAR